MTYKQLVQNLIQAAEQLANTPAVIQVLGNHHTDGCTCPRCKTSDAVHILKLATPDSQETL